MNKTETNPGQDKNNHHQNRSHPDHKIENRYSKHRTDAEPRPNQGTENRNPDQEIETGCLNRGIKTGRLNRGTKRRRLNGFDKINKNFLKQHDRSDCGAVCLSNIISYHGGKEGLEKIRELSGTGRQGTTMLGLCEAAIKLGFRAEGLRADIEYLKGLDMPVILHVVIDGKFRHYIILYHYSRGKFHIGDPSRGIIRIEERELEKIWVSRTLLHLKPEKGRFVDNKSRNSDLIRWFIEIVSKDSTVLLTIVVTGIIVSVLGILIAVYSQALIDNLIPSGNRGRIIFATLLLFMLLIFKALIGYHRQSLIIRQSRDINIRMIDKFFRRLLRQPWSFFNNRHTGDMIARLNDTHRIQHTITLITGELMINGLLLLVSLVAVYIYSATAGIILTAGLPLYLMISRHFHPVILEGQQNVMGAHAVNESNYISTIENIGIIKSADKENEYANSARIIYGAFQQKVFSLGQTGIKLNTLTEITGIILIAGIIAVSITSMMRNNMQTGEFVALLSLANNIIPAAASIAIANIQVQSARVAFERTYEISSGNAGQINRRNGPLKNAENFDSLKIKNLHFRYPGKKLLLDNISLEIKRGEIITIFGENGTGKSTLLNIIQGFYQPESAEILLNGQNMASFSAGSFRKITGVVPQNISLFNTTILGNIVLDSSPCSAKKAVSRLEKYSLLPLFEQFSDGIYTMVEERGLNISGGQKKLIALARALCSDPGLILADELTSSADRHMENFFITLFMKIKHQVPLLQVTHNLKAAKISDEIIVLENGMITSRGSHEELMQFDNLYSSSFMDYFVST